MVNNKKSKIRLKFLIHFCCSSKSTELSISFPNNHVYYYSGIAAAPDFESSAYGSVLYFLESVLPFLEGFYRDFYFPDAATHPNEIDETDHIAKAIVVST